VLDEFGAQLLGVAGHVETELRRDCEPHIVWAKNEMQVLLEGAHDTIDEAVAVGHNGAGAARYDFIERRVEDGLVLSRLGSFAPEILFPYTYESVEESLLGLGCRIAILIHHSGGRLDRNGHDVRVRMFENRGVGDWGLQAVRDERAVGREQRDERFWVSAFG
jgi:hypothetical protein